MLRALGTCCTDRVLALLTGASGTGKTLATRMLAARIGRDINRVDLAPTVDKYIGETEDPKRVLAKNDWRRSDHGARSVTGPEHGRYCVGGGAPRPQTRKKTVAAGSAQGGRAGDELGRRR